MAVSIMPSITYQGMVMVTCSQGQTIGQCYNNPPQFTVKQMCVLAFGNTFEISLESRCTFNRPHVDHQTDRQQRQNVADCPVQFR